MKRNIRLINVIFAGLVGSMLAGCALTNTTAYDASGNVSSSSWSFTNPFTIYAEKSEGTIQVASSSSWGIKANPAENLYVIGKSDDVAASTPKDASVETVKAVATVVVASKGTMSATANSTGITVSNNETNSNTTSTATTATTETK